MLPCMTIELHIPDTVAGCQTLIAELAKTLAEREQKIQEREQQIVTLQQRVEVQQLEIAELLRQAFRKHSERYLGDPGQLKLDFGNSPEAADAAEGLAEAVAQAGTLDIEVQGHTRRKKTPDKPRNEQLPAHLPRYEVEAPVADDVRFCAAHGERKLIGHDRMETLEFEPPKLRVRVTLIAKFACANAAACGVKEPARPEGLVEGNRYGTSVAAEIITAKYGYHLPLYRQQDLFAGSGWTPSRGTLLNILTAAGELLPPFIDSLKGEVLGSGVIGTDDTSVVLLLPSVLPMPTDGDLKSKRIHEVFSAAIQENKKSVTARMWAYRSLTVPVNVFDFTVSRHRDGADAFLVDSQFTGKLLADCYSGYQGITLRSDARIERAACNAHARRKIFEARGNHPLLGAQLLALYRELYDIEDRARGVSAEARLSLRTEEGQRVWQRMREVLDGETAARLLPKEKMAEALGYLRNHWDALRLYLTDPRLPIDNNDVEQLMKQVAIGRKNWLFIGSVAAGERAANFLTLVSSALRNDLDVYAYIKAVLDALLAGSTDYAVLRPDHWAQAHPEAIRSYRKDERRDRVEAKRTRREFRRAQQGEPDSS
jgi:transposase